MHVVSSIADLRAVRGDLPAPVGMVPTMGALHAGHVSLIERARAECATVVVSIFVNPTQFGPGEDLARYPRPLANDLALCEQNGVDVVFTPTTAEMYPPGATTTVEVSGVSERWEGASRPGHFRGVATIVTKLFRAALPDRAYFGEKDYQQLQVVRRLAADLLLNVEVVGCPTVRDPDGLALSSRNVYLSPGERQQALGLSQALFSVRAVVESGITATADELLSLMREVLSCTPEVRVDYAAIVDPTTLEPIERVGVEARALVAGRVAGVHLIDNLPIRASGT